MCSAVDVSAAQFGRTVAEMKSAVDVGAGKDRELFAAGPLLADFAGVGAGEICGASALLAPDVTGGMV